MMHAPHFCITYLYYHYRYGPIHNLGSVASRHHSMRADIQGKRRSRGPDEDCGPRLDVPVAA